jgi:hypothetical protein
MPALIEKLHDDLVRRAAGYGITVRQAELDAEIPGEFDGRTITLNHRYDAAERCFYLAHSIGSIAEWSLHCDRSFQVFRELSQAKQQKASDPKRLERALAAYLAFETRTWELAVWLLEDTGNKGVVPEFTNFGRADMESMRVFHSTGKAPVWRDFFATWNEQIRRGARAVAPVTSHPIPEFQAVSIPKQEIIQEERKED